VTALSLPERVRLVAEFSPVTRQRRSRTGEDGSIVQAVAAGGLLDLVDTGAVTIEPRGAAPVTRGFVVLGTSAPRDEVLAAALGVVAHQRKVRPAAWYLLHLYAPMMSLRTLQKAGLVGGPGRPELTDDGQRVQRDILERLYDAADPLLAAVLSFGYLSGAVARESGVAVPDATVTPEMQLVLMALRMGNSFATG
jgi:hypothetical protein